MKIEKWTFGMGDRFGHQGVAQLRAVQLARQQGIEIFPVWNKSKREHTFIGSKPEDLRAEADAAVVALGWDQSYYVDADHIGLGTVDEFLAASDFYTLDVADFIGQPPDREALDSFLVKSARYIGRLRIPGIEEEIPVTRDDVARIASKFLRAMQEAGRIYRHIAERKGAGNFVTEISIDETDRPQTPTELFFILAMIAGEGIPAQTIAPKFTGRFNKGVDYVGDVVRFGKEFDEALHIVAAAVADFGLPATLKLSVHSGSDKFSLYPVINRLVKKHGAGLHVKTAGTTWLEEVIGLAESGGEGLAIARGIYGQAHAQQDKLAAPYATVIAIDPAKLPDPAEVNSWTGEKFAAALRHVPSASDYNPDLRQLIHVSFKVAAAMGSRYTDALKACEPVIARNVTANLFDRHILPIFGDPPS